MPSDFSAEIGTQSGALSLNHLRSLLGLKSRSTDTSDFAPTTPRRGDRVALSGQAFIKSIDNPYTATAAIVVTRLKASHGLTDEVMSALRNEVRMAFGISEKVTSDLAKTGTFIANLGRRRAILRLLTQRLEDLAGEVDTPGLLHMADQIEMTVVNELEGKKTPGWQKAVA